jgi:2-polyprenyl-3-methyl-5-hydroxy-6-metoxy-1,4-benzoquinol methylase
MSLLMNTLKTVFAARRAQQPPLGPDDDASPDARPDALPDAAPAARPPAWRLLAAQTGVQSQGYDDVARPGVQALFAHQPRRLLDIGCAAGAVSAGLKQSIPGLWAWGCELSEQAAKVAAPRLDHLTTVPREQWSNADLARVETLDTVLLLDVLEHMYNPWAELQFLAQRLPRNAQVIISLPNIGHISVLTALSLGQFPYAALGILDVTHVRFFTFAGMLAMFEETGFELEIAQVLSRSGNIEITQFPAQVAAGNMVLTVDSAEEWERLNTVQFGFRLRPRGS